MKNIKGMICIQNFGASGSLFVHSLLDGHPQLLTLPALYSRELYRFWEETTFYSVEDLVNQFCKSPYNQYWFLYDTERYKAIAEQGLDALGENMDEHIIANEKLFKEYMTSYLNSLPLVSRKEFIKSVYYAWYNQFPSEKEQDVWLLFAFHSNPEKYAEQIIEDFEHVKFLHVVRNPIKSVDSNNKHEFNVFRGRPLVFTNIFVMPSIVATELISKNHVQYGAIRMEDIHSNPELTLQKLANWLEIKFTNTMLYSKFEGKRWWNRNHSIKLENCFNKNFAFNNHLYTFNKLDTYRLNYITTELCKHWKYQNNILNSFIGYMLAIILLVIPFKIECYNNKKFVFWYEDFRRNLRIKKNNRIIEKTAKLCYYLSFIWVFLKNYLKVRWYYLKAMFYQHRSKYKIVSLIDLV